MCAAREPYGVRALSPERSSAGQQTCCCGDSRTQIPRHMSSAEAEAGSGPELAVGLLHGMLLTPGRATAYVVLTLASYTCTSCAMYGNPGASIALEGWEIMTHVNAS